jgi:hypothetical protein
VSSHPYVSAFMFAPDAYWLEPSFRGGPIFRTTVVLRDEIATYQRISVRNSCQSSSTSNTFAFGDWPLGRTTNLSSQKYL